MGEAKFTPGPWTTDESANEQDDYCIWAADGTFLANVGNGEKAVEPGEVRPQGGDCIAFDITTRANAKVMAASPDLYTALFATATIYCEEHCVAANEPHDAICLANAAALEKAREK